MGSSQQLSAVASRRIQARARTALHQHGAPSMPDVGWEECYAPGTRAQPQHHALPPQSEIRDWERNAPEGCILESCEPLTTWVVLMQGPESSQIYKEEIYR